MYYLAAVGLNWQTVWRTGVSNTACTNTDKGKLLHVYELGLLSSDEAVEFEIHLLECESCMTAAESFATQVTLLRHGRQVRHDVAHLSSTERGVPGRRQHIWHRLWPDGPTILKPAFLLVVIVLLLYPAYRGLLTPEGPAFRRFQTINLVPLRSSSSAEFYMSRQRDGLITFFIPDAHPDDIFILQIIDTEDKVIYADSAFSAFDDAGIGHIGFPADLMKSGEYRLIVAAHHRTQAVTQEYKFFIKK